MALTFTSAIRAEIRLPHALADHMVLQRNAPIHIWGWAAPGEQVRVQMQDQKLETTADTLGQWSVFLKPAPAGGPYDLQVTASNTIVLHDVMLGDLWLASGQSNMEMPLSGWGAKMPIRDSDREIAAANRPEIRLLLVARASADHPLDDLSGTWQRCSPETAKSFSAVAYFFGAELQQQEHVAIGLIDSTWGGTPAEAWVSMDALGRDANLAPVWTTWADFIRSQVLLAPTLAAEKREDTEAKANGEAAPLHPWHPDPASFAPAGLFNGMIAPLTPLTIRGVIWYQGETNSALTRAPIYHRLFAGLIADWREHFHQGTFPFLFAQISGFAADPAIESWGAIRDAQRRTLSVANTAMSVTLDLGEKDNGHYADKKTAGHRLALAAAALSYGKLARSAGPLFARADVEGAAMRIWFQDRDQLLTCPAPQCAGFEIAGADHRFYPAVAKLEGRSVVVENQAAVATPRYVRYAWANAPEFSLRSSDGLPSSTFTSEDEPVTLQPEASANRL